MTTKFLSSIRSHALLCSLLFPCLMISSCMSHKEMQSSVSFETDSIARTESHRTIHFVDSVIRCVSFRYDTLEVTIQRPIMVGDVPEFWCQREQNGSELPVMPSAAQNALCETIYIKAVNGSVIDNTEQQRLQLEDYNRLDSLAYKRSSSEDVSEKSDHTNVYNPPDTTPVIIAGLFIIAILVYIIYRRK